jgi:hypothetical protein
MSNLCVVSPSEQGRLVSNTGHGASYNGYMLFNAIFKRHPQFGSTRRPTVVALQLFSYVIFRRSMAQDSAWRIPGRYFKLGYIAVTLYASDAVLKTRFSIGIGVKRCGCVLGARKSTTNVAYFCF